MGRGARAFDECPLAAAAGKTAIMSGISGPGNTRATRKMGSELFIPKLCPALHTILAFSTTRSTRQALVFESLRVRLDLDEIAGLAFVVLVVRVVLVRLDDHLAVDRVLGRRSTSTVTVLSILSLTTRPVTVCTSGLRAVAACVVPLRSMSARSYLYPCASRSVCNSPLGGLRLMHELLVDLRAGTAPDSRVFCPSSVRTRAMPRRTSFSFDVLVSCCVATCMRRPNCSFSSASSSVCSSAAFLPASALFVFSAFHLVLRQPPIRR